MAGELAAEWIRVPDGNGGLKKVWVRDSTARRDIAQLQTDVSGKADAATTLAGYGITDAYTKTQVDGMIPSVPSAYTSNPEMDGTASPGSSTAWARGDHVHPHDSTKADASAIPTKTSDLTNDSGFITSAPVSSVNGQTGAVVLTASDVGAMPSGTTIPTKTSDLTNDSGFITGYTETDPTVPAWAKAANKPTYTAAEVGALPDTTPIPTVPTNVSAFTNDAGYLTSYTETDPTVPSWAKASTKPSYTASEVGALPSSTTIPSKTSDLTNDSGFITSSALSPTSYNTLTPFSDRCTIDSGGYVRIGKMVFIDLVVTTAAAAGTTTLTQMIADTADLIPLKSTQFTVLSAVNNTSRNKTTKAVVSSAGGIRLGNVAASEVVYITGCYITA